MKTEEKTFVLDLLKALNYGIDGQTRDDNYSEDLQGDARKQVLRTVRFLIEKGYKKCSPITNT